MRSLLILTKTKMNHFWEL